MTADMTTNEANVTVEFPMEERIPLLKAVRLKCLDCSGFSSKEVELCPIKKCTLYPYRFGKDPYKKKREYTEEQLEAKRKRMLEIRYQRPKSINQSDTAEETAIG